MIVYEYIYRPTMRAEGKRPSKHPITRPYYDTFLVPIAKTRHVHYRSLSFRRQTPWAYLGLHTLVRDALVLLPFSTGVPYYQNASRKGKTYDRIYMASINDAHLTPSTHTTLYPSLSQIRDRI